MTGDLDIADTDGQAREGWRLGAELCRDCGGYHQTWGILRAAGIVGGIAVDRERLAPTVRSLIRPGHRILIAGAADAGLLQLIVEAVAVRPLAITVVDRCPAPLALVERLAPIPQVAVHTCQACLTAFRDAGAYDLILSHSMLPFLDPTGRIAVLGRLRDALAPGGRLLLTLRTSPPTLDLQLSAHDATWLARAQHKLAGVGPLVAFAGPELPARLADYAAERRQRLDGFHDAAEAIVLLEAAGFQVEAHEAGPDSTTLHYRDGSQTKQSHTFLASAA